MSLSDFQAAYHFVEMKAGDCYWKPGDESEGFVDPCIGKADHMNRLLSKLRAREQREGQTREFAEFANVVQRLR